MPSTLLERRPDIRQAEQKLIAANAKLGVAYTNMFPRLALTGGVKMTVNSYGVTIGEKEALSLIHI